jgi:polar amino acid transport system substrate-binding protein
MVSPVSADPDIFILNTSTGAPYTTPQNDGFQDLVVKEVFRRLGLNARVERYDASARALINANENIDHGVAMRIRGLEKKYPNLVIVDEAIVENDFVAYSNGLDLVTDDWQSLEPFVISHIHGWLIFERNVKSDHPVQKVKSPTQMFSMLEKGRVDIALYERWQGIYLAKQSGMKVSVHEPPLATVKMYMYIHKNYRHLAVKMARALKEMKSDGSYQSIVDKTLNILNKPEN